MPARDDDPDVGGLCAADPLARHLAALTPVPPGLDRDQLMFAAGAARHDRAGVWWKRAFFAQTGVVAAVFLVAIGNVGQPTSDRSSGGRPVDFTYRPPALPPEPRPAAPRSPDVTPADPSDAGKWLQLRADVFAAGLGVLPTPTAPAPLPDRTAVEKSLQLDPGVLAVPYRPKPPPAVEEPERP